MSTGVMLSEVLPAANKAIPGRTVCAKYENKE